MNCGCKHFRQMQYFSGNVRLQVRYKVSDSCGIRQIDMQAYQLGSLLAENTTYAAGSFVVNGNLQMLW